jgi:hypothetical protein
LYQKNLLRQALDAVTHACADHSADIGFITNTKGGTDDRSLRLPRLCRRMLLLRHHLRGLRLLRVGEIR